MNRDDDSFISAYLDGELDREQRPLVESALVSDPELAEKLRGLTSLRDLLSSLNRDFPVDVTARVMGRLRIERPVSSTTRLRRRWLRAANLSVRSPRAALVGGIAATLLLSVAFAVPFLLNRSQSSGPSGAVATRGLTSDSSRTGLAVAPAFRRAAGDATAAGADRIVETANGAASESGLRDVIGGSPSGHSQVQGRRVSSKAGAVDHYRHLLDNPNQHRLFRVTDGGDGNASQQVASVVESTTQFDFYKVTVAQGIEIDPRHPGEATVYVALVSAKGLDALRDRLARALPDRVEESQVEPAVVTQLAEINQVGAHRAAPFGDVLIPREALVAFAAPADQPTIEQERSAPIGEEIVKGRESTGSTVTDGATKAKAYADRGTPAEAPPRDADVRTPAGPAAGSRRREPPEPTFVVLVWVERSRRG
jgi:hypothetical protein